MTGARLMLMTRTRVIFIVAPPDPENAIVHLHARMTDCETSIAELINAQAGLSRELSGVGDHIKSIAEILTAWNNARGFISTLRFLAGFIKVVMIIGAFFGVMWLFLKTGVWPVELKGE